jgi:hypothetical protein
MAGQPKKRAALAAIEQKGGVEYLTEFLLSGGTITQLAGELNLNRGYLHRILQKHPDYSVALEQAREEAADAHAEMGFEIMRKLRKERKEERANAGPGSKAAQLSVLDISIAREEVQHHRFIAEAWNQKRYGSNKGQTQITVNLGDMHLDALKKMKTIKSEPKVIDHDD